MTVSPPFRDRDDVRAVTIEGLWTHYHVLSVAKVEEIGVLPVGLTPFNVEAPADAALEESAADFAARIDRQLALSGSQDAVIFVHGYNVGFEYPLLVSKELRHHLGYRGAFITFAWPATPSRFACFQDLETPSSKTARAAMPTRAPRSRCGELRSPQRPSIARFQSCAPPSASMRKSAGTRRVR